METFVNDTPRLTYCTNLDLSGYDTLQIRYRKPDGTTGCWAAILCATDDNCIYYDITLGELDQVGEWLYQGIVFDPGVRLTGQWCSFIVNNPLALNCTTMVPTTAAP